MTKSAIFFFLNIILRLNFDLFGNFFFSPLVANVILFNRINDTKLQKYGYMTEQRSKTDKKRRRACERKKTNKNILNVNLIRKSYYF